MIPYIDPWRMAMKRTGLIAKTLHLTVIWNGGAVKAMTERSTGGTMNTLCGTDVYSLGGPDTAKRGHCCKRCLAKAMKVFKSIHKWDANTCLFCMLNYNGEHRNLTEIESNLEFYREHCRSILQERLELPTDTK